VLVTFIGNAQSFKSYRELKTICDASLVDSKKALIEKGFGRGTIYVGDDWGVYYTNMNDSLETVFIRIDPKQITYNTADRSCFLKILESATSSKMMKELSTAEKSDLGLNSANSIFKGEGGYFTYSQNKVGYSTKIIYSISWISTTTVNAELKPNSDKTSSENNRIERQRKDNYEERQKDIQNRTPLNYVIWSVGGLLASEEFQASTGSSTNLQSVYSTSKKYGGDVIGFNLCVGGIYSPWGLNKNFRSNFDISFRYGASYSGIGFDLGFKDPSGYDYTTTWFSNVAGGFGPALSFSDSEDEFAITFYYLPQFNYNFGGSAKSPISSSSEELIKRDSKNFGYRGSFGVDIKLTGFYLGFEYGMYKDYAIWNYSSASVTTPVDVKSKLNMQQIIFKIGFALAD
jgi:hypothetical protein